MKLFSAKTKLYHSANIIIIVLFVEVFSQFTDDEFDAKTHATRIIQSHAISQQLAKLAEGVNLLDRELHSQVFCTLLLLTSCC